MNVNFPLRSIVKVLIYVITALVSIYILLAILRYHLGFGVYGAIIDWFDLDRESSISTWFSQMQLAFAALLLLVIARLTQIKGAKDYRYWYFLAGIIGFMSLDEGAEIHEKFARPMRELLGVAEFSGPLSNAWVVVAVPIVILVGLILVRFLWRLPANTRVLFIVSALVFLSGAIGSELMGGGHSGFAYSLFVAAEEGAEMIGVWMLVYVLTDYIYRYLPKASIHLR